MIRYTDFFGLKIASYGLIVFMGIVICSSIVKMIADKRGHTLRQIYTAFFLGSIGAFIGAKLLSLISLTASTGIWNISFREFLKAGLSYYGGLFGFLGSIYLVCKFTKLVSAECLNQYVFLLPLLHFFWKIACFMGGCCFGIHYEGPGSVTFPDGVNALSGTPVFPIQLVEAFTALFIAVSIVCVTKMYRSLQPVGLYLVFYGTTRFMLEFFRFHDGISICNAFVFSIISVMTGMILLNRNIMKNRIIQKSTVHTKE